MPELPTTNKDNGIIHLRDTFYDALINTSRFNEKMFNIFVETYSVYLKTVFEDNKIAKIYQS